MDQCLLYPVGSTAGCRYAASSLEQAGFLLTDHPAPEITHLLLDVPTFDERGMLRDGTDLKEILRMLPLSITVIGGNLHPEYLSHYRKIDLLKDPGYLAKNAAITAECALQVAAPLLNTTFRDSPTLILGWGRIGKCLANLLSCLSCPVTVAARKPADRAMLEALGYQAVDFPEIPRVLEQHKLLFNTVPELPLSSSIPDTWKNGIAIDLASYPGMQGDTVIPARGLPGKYAPESSGRLIADTILRICKEDRL